MLKAARFDRKRRPAPEALTTTGVAVPTASDV
jgi:hypothetical protein